MWEYAYAYGGFQKVHAIKILCTCIVHDLSCPNIHSLMLNRVLQYRHSVSEGEWVSEWMSEWVKRYLTSVRSWTKAVANGYLPPWLWYIHNNNGDTLRDIKSFLKNINIHYTLLKTRVSQLVKPPLRRSDSVQEISKLTIKCD